MRPIGEKRPRLGLHDAFVLLALCALATVGTGLWFVDHLAHRYETALRETRDWTRRVGAIRDLGDAGLAAVRAGDGVGLTAADAETARARRDAAIAAYRTRKSAVAAEIAANTRVDEATRLRDGLLGMDLEMVRMLAASDRLLDAVAAGGRPRSADLADLHHATLRFLDRSTQGTQAARALSLDAQGRHLEAARALGAQRFWFAGMVGLLAMALLVYGLRVARETRRAADRLAESQAAAERANQLKSQFLANMSHELRTPLNAIIGYAEILSEDASERADADAVKDLARIERAGKHLLHLINDLLDLSKIEAGQTEIDAAPASVQSVIDAVLETVGPVAAANGAKLSVRGVGPDLTVHTDALKLRQCLINLVGNACKFAPHGAVEIAVSEVGVGAQRKLDFAVRDDGVGMTREQMERLFTPFVQADSSIANRFGGTGLGLAITRRLAQLLGGDVTVTSEKGVGSTFTLTVAAELATAGGDALTAPQGAPRALIIDDEPDCQDLFRRALGRVGFHVEAAATAEAGLLRAAATKPDLVLLDLRLPGRSGWEALAALKADPRLAGVPVIVVSVDVTEEEARGAGAAAAFQKPIDRDRLADAALGLVARRPPLAAAA
jgi:signal transduction histidine kinase